MAQAMALRCIVVVISLLGVAVAQDSCYAFNANPYLNFASKTAYDHAYNKRGIDAVPGHT